MNIFIKIFIFIFLISSANANELSFRDSLKSGLMTFIVSSYFQSHGYGKVDSIKYDSEKKYMGVELSPEGEAQKLKIEVEKIEFAQMQESNQTKYYILLKNLTTNRIWLNRMLKDSSANAIKIPINEANYMALSAIL